MADYTPEPHYMLSMANQGLPWWKALAELIDNGFDAKGNRVEIAVKGRTVTITDNGRGMADVMKSIRLGGHCPVNGRGLGMYGVGLKDAWLSSGDRIDISTVHCGKKTSITVDIRDISATWQGPDPVVTDSTEKPGTVIVLHLRPGRNTPSDDVFRKLALIFSPAIVQGLQIVRVVNGKSKPLAAVPLPEFSESVQDTFDVNGKSVSLHVGILKPESRMTEGPFCFAYRHRIIEASSLGAKSMSCMAMGGMITLGDGWEFTKNKDGIAENCDALEDAIYNRIKHLLVKANKLAMDVQSDQIRTELESMVNSAVDDAKREARHSTRESQGTVKATGTRGKRTKASKIHADLPGSVTEAGEHVRRRGLRIDWCQIQNDLIGKYDSRTNTVNMNLEHPFVAAAKMTPNYPALFAIAFAVYSDWLCTHKDGHRTMFEVDDFGSTLGRLIKGMKFNDDKTRKASGSGSVPDDVSERVCSA
jgi:hypothetical protein